MTNLFYGKRHNFFCNIRTMYGTKYHSNDLFNFVQNLNWDGV